LQCPALVQLSSFNVYVEGFPAAGETLVYNTFSGGSVVLDNHYLAQLRAAADRAEPDTDLADRDLGVLVESRAAEEREFLDWLASVKSDTQTVSALVSTSYACNLACTYCFQEEYMNGKTMSAATADATAAFLSARVREVRPEKVELCFIGGEPLLHPHLIERISLGLRPACEAIGAAYSFQIVTNGTLMTPEVIERLKAVGLTAVQVTIDGDECSHGITRMDKKGQNTFHRTWQNVLACLAHIPISLQGNYTPENLHGFLPLLERMKRDGVDPARVPRIKFKPALSALGSPADAGYESCTWSNARPEVQLALGDAVRAFGYQTHDHLELGPCAIHQINHFSIDPEGHVYKCPGFLGKPEWATGSVETGLTDRHRQLNRLANTRECGACTYRPTCAGGCIATQWVAAEAPEGLNCERKYFDTVGIDILKRNYYWDTLERDEALAAIEQIPGRMHLPVVSEKRAHARVARAPLVQLRSPRRAQAEAVL
jgi:uncharacterized protein